MHPPPIALGLTICEKVIVEQRTGNITIVSTFTRLMTDAFPSRHERFAFVAALTGGQGEATVDLAITQLETDDEIYAVQGRIRLANRLAEHRVVFHVRECSFPAPGAYDATLYVDGDPIARRRFAVAKGE